MSDFSYHKSCLTSEKTVPTQATLPPPDCCPAPNQVKTLCLNRNCKLQ